ncbi:MAG: sensor histidine kinase [Deltaproteobacteria bacterium]|nr:sensor histidine kinase [Deltaproteobacteria bacterium]
MDWNGPGRLVLIARDVSVAMARETALQRERDDLESEVRKSTSALREIQRMEGLMKRSLEEKDTLLKEIHHRVKNNLQMVSSLLSLQQEQMPEGKPQSLLAESVTRRSCSHRWNSCSASSPSFHLRGSTRSCTEASSPGTRRGGGR